MLTDLACRKAGKKGNKKGKTYRLADELGLYLYVLPSGHRSWRLGYWFPHWGSLSIGAITKPMVAKRSTSCR